MQVFVFDQQAARDSFMIRCNSEEAQVINEALSFFAGSGNDETANQLSTQMDEAVNPPQ